MKKSIKPMFLNQKFGKYFDDKAIKKFYDSVGHIIGDKYELTQFADCADYIYNFDTKTMPFSRVFGDTTKGTKKESSLYLRTGDNSFIKYTRSTINHKDDIFDEDFLYVCCYGKMLQLPSDVNAKHLYCAVSVYNTVMTKIKDSKKEDLYKLESSIEIKKKIEESLKKMAKGEIKELDSNLYSFLVNFGTNINKANSARALGINLASYQLIDPNEYDYYKADDFIAVAPVLIEKHLEKLEEFRNYNKKWQHVEPEKSQEEKDLEKKYQEASEINF